MNVVLGIVLSLVGCGGQGPSEADKERPRAARDRDEAPRDEARKKGGERTGTAERGRQEAPDQPTVVFFVLDTVRSANLSVCGYERPTTPVLEKLAGKAKVASFTCDAYSAATWTVPSHTSYFTGLAVPEHGNDSMGFRFDAAVPTLSELMKEQGYQAVMISANPTLSEASGLRRGFDVVEVAKGVKGMRGRDFRKTVEDVVGGLKHDKPLFLFVNIFDAHDPYPAIPADVGWVPEREELPFDVHDEERDEPYHQFLKGEMSEEEAEAYLAHVRDGYDYGISEADRNVDAVMKLLRQSGWLEPGYRLALTSDHGEFLGEHDLLRHGCFVWEPVVRVPFLWFDSERDEPLELPEPFSATNAFWLLQTGELPDPVVQAIAFSKRRKYDIKGGADMAALWNPDHEKLVWMDGETMRFDLASDPDEARPQPLPRRHPQREQLEAMGKAHAEHLATARAGKKDPDLVKELEALGYVE